MFLLGECVIEPTLLQFLLLWLGKFEGVGETLFLLKGGAGSPC